MATGVYKTTKKDGSVYYRVSITYKNKHISIGSYDDEFGASMAYAIANDVLYKPGTYYIDKDMHTTSYNHIAAELSNNASLKSSSISDGTSVDFFTFFPYAKFISLINFRDNGIYIKTPIYLCDKSFLYFLNPENILTFSTDDLFYYSHHTILCRGGYYFVNDYGMQTSILSRFGIRNHSVKGRDYIFRNGDEHDYRYENVCVINKYNGVNKIEKNGRTFFQSRIHINGNYIIGIYKSENEAAIAYNKVVDILENIQSVSYIKNYIEDMSYITYASIYNSIKISKKLTEYIEGLKQKRPES